MTYSATSSSHSKHGAGPSGLPSHPQQGAGPSGSSAVVSVSRTKIPPSSGASPAVAVVMAQAVPQVTIAECVQELRAAVQRFIAWEQLPSYPPREGEKEAKDFTKAHTLLSACLKIHPVAEIRTALNLLQAEFKNTCNVLGVVIKCKHFAFAELLAGTQIDAIHLVCKQARHFPLSLAIIAGEEELTTKLLQKGADPNAKLEGFWGLGNEEHTPFAICMKGFESPVVPWERSEASHLDRQKLTRLFTLLLQYNANPQTTITVQHSALSFLISVGAREEALLLLGKIEDVTKNTKAKTSPLHVAAAAGWEEMINALLKKGISPDSMQHTAGWFSSMSHQTPLHVAVEYRQDGAAAALLKAGANPNIKMHVVFPNHAGARKPLTSFQLAVQKKDVDMQRVFAEANVPLEYDTGSVDTALTLQCHDAIAKLKPVALKTSFPVYSVKQDSQFLKMVQDGIDLLWKSSQVKGGDLFIAPLLKFLEKESRANPDFHISFVNLELLRGGATRACYHPSNRQIYLGIDFTTPEEVAYTLIHELAHMAAHAIYHRDAPSKMEQAVQEIADWEKKQWQGCHVAISTHFKNVTENYKGESHKWPGEFLVRVPHSMVALLSGSAQPKTLEELEKIFMGDIPEVFKVYRDDFLPLLNTSLTATAGSKGSAATAY